jgi:CRISPR type III-B/RAMP module-associated protein Cmr5
VISCIEAVRELDGKIEKEKFGQSYRARARRMASMVYETGLLSTIGYLYAKATKDTYEKVAKANMSGAGRIDPQLLRNEQGKLPGKEELAHAAYLNHVLVYISSKLGRDGQEKDPIGLIKTLAENPVELGVAESLLRPFLIELKHLAEAVLEAEES